MRSGSVLQILERWRFSFLLACLLGLFLIQPLLPLQPNGEERIGADTALIVVLVACVSSLKRSRAMLLLGLALIAVALAAYWIAHLAPSRPAVLCALVAAMVAMSFATGSLLWHLVEEKVVRAETILGGICVYFLLGCIWAMIYSLIEQLQPGSLSAGAGSLHRPEQTGTLLVPELLYYSVFVLTTIGPQDVHPISSAARAWTGVEAMAGQLFLVIFISRGGAPRSQREMEHGVTRSQGAGARRFAVFLTTLLIAVRAAAEEDPAAPPDGEAHEQSLQEINKQLTNPVSSIWSITFQQNNFRVDPGPGSSDRWSSNLLFQPVLPVGISEDWNLITRPVIPLFVSTPRPDPEPGDPGHVGRSTAFGDVTLMQLVSPSPKLAESWLLGIGPTWMFPTAASDFTGSGKFQVGPAALVGYLSEKWILGALFQNWWSFAGQDSRPDASSMNLQPVASYFLPDGWSIAYSGNILANWENPADDTFTVPIGAAVAKVVKFGKLPVHFALGVQSMAIQPDLYGQKWNVQLVIAPVIPKLIKGYLTQPSEMSVGLGR